MSGTLALTAHEVAAEPVLADCMAVMARAFDPQFGEAWTSAQTRSMLDLPGSRLIIGRLGDAPAGFGLLRSIAGEAELLLLAVDPAYRRQGFGSLILEQCLAVAIHDGARAMYLEMRDGNPAAGLYLNAGFRQYNRRRHYYRGQSGDLFDAMSYSLSLDPGLHI